MTHPTILGHILMIEDNLGDVRLTKEMFAEEGLDPTFHVMENAEDALDFLHRRGEYADAPSPDVILLDWHLPATTGGDILSEIRSIDDFEDIPVVVQTGSGVEIEVLQEREDRADGFVPKPISPDELQEFVDAD